MVCCNALCKAALLCLLFTGCGYRWRTESPSLSRPSITVPFVPGDDDATLTNEIIHTLTTSGLAEVRRRGGMYRLAVAFVDSLSETTGFRLDLQKVKGGLRKTSLPVKGAKPSQFKSLYMRGAAIRSLTDLMKSALMSIMIMSMAIPTKI